MQMGYLKKNGDGSLLYSVVNTAEPDADGEWPLAGLGFSRPTHCSVSLCTTKDFKT